MLALGSWCMVFSPKFCYFYYEYTMRIGFIFALKYFSLHGLQESIIFHWRTNMHARWSRKTSLFRKTPLSPSKKNCTSVSDLRSSYSWHPPHRKGRIPAPRNTQSTDAMSDKQKNNPARDSNIPVVSTGMLPGQYDMCWVTDRTFCMDCTGGALPSEHLPLSQTAERLSHVHWC